MCLKVNIAHWMLHKGFVAVEYIQNMCLAGLYNMEKLSEVFHYIIFNAFDELNRFFFVYLNVSIEGVLKKQSFFKREG